MAQFVELMKQAKRMCEAHEDCDTCPIGEEMDDLGANCPFYGALDAVAIEQKIACWAARNLERPKVYPSWKEYLRQIGVIEPGEAPGDSSAVYRNILREIDGLNKRIPKEIARKLGIEPVGGGE